MAKISSKTLEAFEDDRRAEFLVQAEENNQAHGALQEEPIQYYLDKLGEDLQRELGNLSVDDEKLLNLALGVLLLMFRRASREDFKNVQDLYLEIKYQGKLIRGKISNWKQIAPQIAQGGLTIGAGALGFAPLAGQALKVVPILSNGAKFFTGIGAASQPLNFLGQGVSPFSNIISSYNMGEKTVLEIDLDKMKQQQSHRTQTSQENTSKCSEIARKVNDLGSQRFSVFQQMAGV